MTRVRPILVAAALAVSAAAFADGRIDDAVRLLHDSDAGRRLQAARDLARAGPGAESATPALNRVVADAKERADVRVEAFHALRRIGVDLAPAVSAMTELLGNADVRARAAAAAALGIAAEPAAAAAPALGNALADRSDDVRHAAAVALGRIGRSARIAMPALLTRAGDRRENAEVRDAAREALSVVWGLAEPKDAPVVAALADLASRAASDRDAAARALAGFGNGAVPAVPALVSMLRSPDATVRAAAAAALGAIGPAAAEAAPDLERAARDADAEVARRAAAALAAVGPSAPAPSAPPIPPSGGKPSSAFDETAWRRHNDRGCAARDAIDYPTAGREFEAALDLLARAGVEDMRLAETLYEYGILLGYQHRWPEAEAATRRSIAIRERLEDKPSTSTGWAFNNLADDLKGQDRNVEAEAMARQALMIFERRSPPEPHAVAFVCNHLAVILMNQERLDEATKHVMRALDSWRKLHGDEHENVGRAWNNLGSIMWKRKSYAESERAYRAAAAVWMKVLGRSHRWTFMPYHNLGLLYEDQERWTDAETALRTAIELEKSGRVAPDSRADTLDVLARVLRGAGRAADALAVEAEAKRLRDEPR